MELVAGLRPRAATWLLLPTVYATLSIPWLSTIQSYSSAQIRVGDSQAGLHVESSVVGGCSVSSQSRVPRHYPGIQADAVSVLMLVGPMCEADLWHIRYGLPLRRWEYYVFSDRTMYR
jgi:hypothetical protein